MGKLKRYKTIICSLIVFGILGTGTPSFAGPPMPRHGFFHGPNPLFELIVVGTRHLFLREGEFYRKGPSGYVLVEAPEGAVIPVLPAGYGIRVVQGVKYYYFKGVYYVRVPDGYMVVAPPVIAVAQKGAEPQTVTCIGEVTVAVDRLNVRSGPGMKYDVVALAYQQEHLKIYQESNGWIYVELPSGRLGWVDKQFTRSQIPAPVG